MLLKHVTLIICYLKICYFVNMRDIFKTGGGWEWLRILPRDVILNVWGWNSDFLNHKINLSFDWVITFSARLLDFIKNTNSVHTKIPTAYTQNNNSLHKNTNSIHTKRQKKPRETIKWTSRRVRPKRVNELSTCCCCCFWWCCWWWSWWWWWWWWFSAWRLDLKLLIFTFSSPAHFVFSQSVLLLPSCVIQQRASIFKVEDVRLIQASCVWWRFSE